MKMKYFSLRNLIIIAILFTYLSFLLIKTVQFRQINQIIYSKNVKNYSVNVNIVDLSKNLADEFENIKCKKSTGYKDLNPTFCVHDYQTDAVSKDLWSNKVYEEEILSN